MSRKKSGFLSALVLTTAVLMNSLSLVSVYAAPLYKDVPSTHWAYESISRIADRGLIVGDTQGNFNPNSSIDKFETAKILAKMAGYKYTNVSDSEKEYYQKAYDKNKSLLSQYGGNFSKWNSSADREIAFLLEKEVLTVEDLNQFVILKEDGTEALRALSREEVAVFFVKLMGHRNQAIYFTDTNAFADDSMINVTYKVYVYYLRSLGVVSGDTDNRFNPNGAVTRAEMAVMCDQVLQIMEGGSEDGTNDASYYTSLAGDAGVTQVQTISGTIDKYYDSLDAVQILTSDGKKNIYKIAASASINIDGFLKTASDLEEGMSAIVVLNNNEVLDMKAQSTANAASGAPAASTTSTETAANTGYLTVEGTVTAIDTVSVTKTISIEVRMINAKGQITSEIRSYAIADECIITRADQTVSFTEIAVGEGLSARVSGNRVYNIYLAEKDKKITDGKLVEKYRIDETGTVILSILDQEGGLYDFQVTDKSVLSRRGLGTCVWNELRVGDHIDVTCEYDKIIELYAYGEKSSVSAWVDEVHISRENSYIVARENQNGDAKTYPLISGTVDSYSLRVGSRVRLYLDSEEVEMVSLLEDAESNSVTGYVQSIRNSYLVVQDATGISGRTMEIRYNSDTVFFDSYTGKTVTAGKVDEGAKVYIIFSSSDSLYAKTVTILTQ